jgi:hypothetical protein
MHKMAARGDDPERDVGPGLTQRRHGQPAWIGRKGGLQVLGFIPMTAPTMQKNR